MVYSYTYLGKQYSGSDERPVYSIEASRDSALKVVASYPVGAKVEVKVDPSNPSRNRLKSDFFHENDRAVILILTGIAGLSTLSLVSLYARRRTTITRAVEKAEPRAYLVAALVVILAIYLVLWAAGIIHL